MTKIGDVITNLFCRELTSYASKHFRKGIGHLINMHKLTMPIFFKLLLQIESFLYFCLLFFNLTLRFANYTHKNKRFELNKTLILGQN